MVWGNVALVSKMPEITCARLCNDGVCARLALVGVSAFDSRRIVLGLVIRARRLLSCAVSRYYTICANTHAQTSDWHVLGRIQDPFGFVFWGKHLSQQVCM